MGTSIVILTFNKIEYTKKCLESIKKYTKNEEIEIIMVDNGSTDDTRLWLKEQKDIKCIFNDKNEGFPKGCNIGIKNSKNDNDILLLNNDTIVTENWLSNLRKCLYSDNDIGAVGPITNSSPYYQAISVPYDNEEELHKFCQKHNVSNKDLWEQRQKLIGFCMLIKRKALDKVGFLDERFSPGNYEDDDISIRLIESGYRLFLCKDTFIHHYGSASFSDNESYHNLLCRNEEKFRKKWGFTSRENMCIYKNYEKFITDKNPNILEISCGTGASALYVMQKIDCKYYGYDTNYKVLGFLDKNMMIFSKDIYLNHTKFDYIIITNVMDFIGDNNINKAIINCIDYNTKFIFNLSEDENNENVIESILKCIGSDYVLEDGIKEENIYSKSLNRYYLIFKNKVLKKIDQNIRWIDSKHLDINGMVELSKNDELCVRYLIQYIIKMSKSVSYDLNNFAKQSFKNNIVCCGEIYRSAYDYDNNDINTLKNYSSFYYNLGEFHMALIYLKRLEKVYIYDKDTRELYEKVLKGKSRINKTKYILRRIEFDIDKEESSKEFKSLICNDLINDNDILMIIEREIINKIYMYNFVAITFFECKKYDNVLTFLLKAYELNNDDLDTNYNLAYILNMIGESELALSYLCKLKHKDNKIKKLICEIEEENINA